MSLEISLHLLTLPFLTSTIVIYLTSLFLMEAILSWSDSISPLLPFFFVEKHTERKIAGYKSGFDWLCDLIKKGFLSLTSLPSVFHCSCRLFSFLSLYLVCDWQVFNQKSFSLLFSRKSEDEEGEGVNISGYFIMLAFTFIIISVLALPFF